MAATFNYKMDTINEVDVSKPKERHESGYDGSIDATNVYLGPEYRLHQVYQSSPPLLVNHRQQRDKEWYEDKIATLEYKVTSLSSENEDLLANIRRLESDLFDKTNDLDHYRDCKESADHFKKQLIQLEEDKFSLSEQLRARQTQLETIQNLLKFKANLFEESELMNEAIKQQLSLEKDENHELQLKLSQTELLLKEANYKLDHSIELPKCVNKLRPWIDVAALINSLIISLLKIAPHLGFGQLPVVTADVQAVAEPPTLSVPTFSEAHLSPPTSSDVSARVRRKSETVGPVVPRIVDMLPSVTNLTDNILLPFGLTATGLKNGLAQQIPFVFGEAKVADKDLSDVVAGPRLWPSKLQDTITSQLQEAITSQLVLIDNQLKQRLGIDAKLINDSVQPYAKLIPGLTSWTTEDVKLPSESKAQINCD